MNRSDHRPTIISEDGSRQWLMGRYVHRRDGPAIIRPTGEEEYFFYGQRVSKKEFLAMNGCPVAIKIKYCFEYNHDQK